MVDRRPTLAATIAMVTIGVAFFVFLGGWQVRRAHEKQALFAAFDAPPGAPSTLARARAVADASHYPLVEVAGRFDPRHRFILDNQSRDGRRGVMLFDVFEPESGGDALLVDRGFVARDASGALPALPDVPSGAQHVRALYAPPPGAGIRLGGNPLPAQATWPKTTIYIDVAQIAADVGHALDPRVLLQVDALDAGDRTLVRQWRPDVFPPERHFAYAFTWFTFAAITVVVAGVLHRRRTKAAP